jgi:hypothetical protein
MRPPRSSRSVPESEAEATVVLAFTTESKIVALVDAVFRA